MYTQAIDLPQGKDGKDDGDPARGPGVGRVGQVVAESQPDPAPRAAGPDHHQAPGRMEPEQMGNGGEDVGGGTQPYPGHPGPALGVGGAAPRGRCAVHAASLGSRPVWHGRQAAICGRGTASCRGVHNWRAGIDPMPR